MTSRDPFSDDGPELLPPAELLHLRAELSRPPSATVRAQHVAATAMAARQRGNSPMGRFASRGARAAVAIVASLAITSGLAGAQLLPDQAQRLLSNVSERFAPSHSDPPAEPARPGDATTPGRDDDDDERPSGDRATREDGTTTTTADPLTADDAEANTTTTRPESPTTTIAGPEGPGSPDDPTDPGPTDPGPTDPGPTDPTTTTTVPPTTTTTVPPTTTTTAPPPTTTTAVPLTPDDPPREGGG